MWEVSGHTPGPWTGRPSFDPVCIWGTQYVGLEFAFSCAPGDKRSEYLANARLIAAAPDLLEALKLIVRLRRDALNDSLLSMDAEHPTLLAYAEAAIARATQPLTPTNEES